MIRNPLGFRRCDNVGVTGFNQAGLANPLRFCSSLAELDLIHLSFSGRGNQRFTWYDPRAARGRAPSSAAFWS